jgi:hypothetical protein
MPGTLKPIPSLHSDDGAEQFVAEANLMHYDLSGFRPHSFEFERKAAQIELNEPAERDARRS